MKRRGLRTLFVCLAMSGCDDASAPPSLTRPSADGSDATAGTETIVVTTDPDPQPLTPRVTAQFPDELTADAWLSLSDRGTVVHYRPRAVSVDGGALLPLAAVPVARDGTRISYPGVLAGVDLVFDVGNLAVHQSYVLRERPSFVTSGEVAFVEAIDAAGVLEARVHGVPVGPDAVATDAPIELVRVADGEAVARIVNPIAWDANPHGQTRVTLRHAIARAPSGELTYRLLVPSGYLLDAGRTWPVTLDPTWELPCAKHWCDDGDPCTYDQCVENTPGAWGCQHLVADAAGALPAGQVTDDGDASVPEGHPRAGDLCWSVWTCRQDEAIRADWGGTAPGGGNYFNGGCDTSATLRCAGSDSACDRGNPCVDARCVRSTASGEYSCEYRDNDATSCWGPFGTCTSAATSGWGDDPEASACTGYDTPTVCEPSEHTSVADCGCPGAACGFGESCDPGSATCVSQPDCGLGFTVVSSGRYNSCALDELGAARCWGNNDSGQSVAPPGTFERIAAGRDHACALDAAGMATCWGSDSFGQASPSSDALSEISAGTWGTAAIAQDGTLRFWGWEGYVGYTLPAGVFEQVSTGLDHACAIDSSHALHCWGYDNLGQATPPGGQYREVAAGGQFSCAIAETGALSCWGDPTFGQTSPPAGQFAHLAAGREHACAIDMSAQVHCWGRNENAEASPPPGPFVGISAGEDVTCALAPSGAITCWGLGSWDMTSPPACGSGSSDPEAWTRHDAPTTQHLNGVAWSGSRFVAVGVGGTIVWSVDGSAWTPATTVMPSSNFYIAVAYGGGQFVAVGTNGYGTHYGAIIATSPDGETWTARAAANSPGLGDVAFGNGRWVATGNLGSIEYSDDGVTWANGPTAADHLDGVAFLGGQFIVVGHAGILMTSSDGLAWTTSNTGYPDRVFRPAYGKGIYLAVIGDGTTGVTLTTTDLVSWTATSVPGTTFFRNVAFGGDRFAVVGPDGILVSPDGDAWSSVVSGADFQGGDIVWGGDRFVAVGQAGRVYVGQ